MLLVSTVNTKTCQFHQNDAHRDIAENGNDIRFQVKLMKRHNLH